ncbi:hypothetical protein PLUA15_340014 [Pseudomonas lundensis]|uniref:Uncharacterized protein n=1 Tax=Pseudomonas lundensis TaxID=86185 RepID=A0AAX2HAW1_9PSED|nr:hypothetical protein PLUA15_340014 [Pseudomonas lundensis]
MHASPALIRVVLGKFALLASTIVRLRTALNNKTKQGVSDDCTGFILSDTGCRGHALRDSGRGAQPHWPPDP